MHVRDEELELYALGRLSAGQASQVESHITECGECGGRLPRVFKFPERLAELSRVQSADKRREPRIATDDPASIQVINPVSAEQWDVRVINVSKSGMRVRTAKFLDLGCHVKIRLKEMIAFGIVCYCVKAEEEFHAGIKLHQVL